MQRTTICGLDRTAMTAAGVTRSALTIDEVRADARELGKAQIIKHRITKQLLILLPGGATWGRVSNWDLAEALSVANTLPCGWDNRIDEEVG